MGSGTHRAVAITQANQSLHDACKKEACAIQACLTRHNHQESQCKHAMAMLIACCQHLSAEKRRHNVHCSVKM